MRGRKRQEQYRTTCQPRSPGSIRRKECTADKITQAIAVAKQGFRAHYMLADSGFGSKGFILAICQIKNGALFEELLEAVIRSIADSGSVDLRHFKRSPEHALLKTLFEESFLGHQRQARDKTA